MSATALILGDQLSPSNPAVEGAERVVLIESMAAIGSRRYHRARLQLVISAMRHRADELRAEGREVVELREAPSLRRALTGSGIDDFRVMEPESPRLAALLVEAGGEMVRSNAFLADREEFESWASGRSRITMEPFYRNMRKSHGVLLNADGGPEGGKWNLDSENRRPPKEGLSAPAPWLPSEDAIDAGVHADISRWESAGLELWGMPAPRAFAATAAEAEEALDDFISSRLAGFGPWQDAMVPGERTLFHANLAAPMNLGLLEPLTVIRRAEAEYRSGNVPLQSAEGFIRQVLGWREFVRAMHAHRSGLWQSDNALAADQPLPAAFHDADATDWECLRVTVESVAETGYAHHIERLMVLGNVMLLLGVEPRAAFGWFRESFVDAADWVMEPNVTGMAIHADGGAMMTKPYAAGGNYISRMSRHCRSCRYNPKLRTGPEACPLTSLYWDFLARHRERFASNPRMALAVRGLDRIDPGELGRIRSQAAEIRSAMS